MNDFPVYVVVAPIDKNKLGSFAFEYKIEDNGYYKDYRKFEEQKTTTNNSIAIIILILGLLALGIVIFFMFYFQKVKEILLKKMGKSKFKENSSPGSDFDKLENKVLDDTEKELTDKRRAISIGVEGFNQN